MNSPPRRPFRPPPPTRHEIKLRAALRSTGFPFKTGAVIWYTTRDKYTPDFLIGERLIVEVIGSVHLLPFRKSPDRLRRRALKAMGYKVMEIDNLSVEHNPERVVEKITEMYYQATESGNSSDPRIIKVRGNIHEPIIRVARSRIENLARKLCTQISVQDWTMARVRELISKNDHDIIESQSAMDIIMLLCFGLNLKPFEGDGQETGNSVDFAFAANFFERALTIMTELFGEGGNIGMKNLLNISAPNMMKNIVLKGGAKKNPGLFKINSKEALISMIHEFNLYFSRFGIIAEEEDVITEICESNSNFNDGAYLDWVRSLCQPD